MYKDGLRTMHLANTDVIAASYEQNKRKPDWKSLVRVGEFKEAADRLLSNIKQQTLFESLDIANLYFEAGNMLALANEYGKAIDCFRNAIQAAEPASKNCKWNDYVKGVIAFLEKDKEMLKECIQNMLKGRINRTHIPYLNLLQNMLTHTDASYLQIKKMQVDDCSFTLMLSLRQ